MYAFPVCNFLKLLEIKISELYHMEPHWVLHKLQQDFKWPKPTI